MSPDFYDRAIARIRRLIAAIGLVGAAIAAVRFGLRSGCGFALGALLSYLSFHMIRGVAGSIGAAPTRRVGAYAALFFMRYGLLGAAVYVIVKYLEVSPMALLAGLFASAAAVFAEILYELAFSK
ncbi:MAG TPA: ATP synthase subunit I [Bryobacteraceae bacterium]|nr:ATP synthase subunit I [Bryobacteraceae bacterium]